MFVWLRLMTANQFSTICVYEAEPEEQLLSDALASLNPNYELVIRVSRNFDN